MTRKNFIAKNDPFICSFCGEFNPKSTPGYRNHCRKCLYSLHVDEQVPGDRINTCKGLMEPIMISPSTRKEFIITHRCQKCGVERNNKSANDDSVDRMLNIQEKSGMDSTKLTTSGFDKAHHKWIRQSSPQVDSTKLTTGLESRRSN